MKQGGFTLLELLISVTLLALMATLITSGLRVASSNWDRSHARIEAAQEMRLVEHFIFRELSEARPLQVRLEDGKNSLFQGEPERIAFTALLPTQQGVGGLYSLVLYAEPYARGERLVLSYRLYRPNRGSSDPEANAQPAPQPTRHRVLLGSLRRITFDFYGPLEGGAGSGWQPEWRHLLRLPEMVRLRYVSKGNEARGIVVPLRLTVSPAAEELGNIEQGEI